MGTRFWQFLPTFDRTIGVELFEVVLKVQWIEHCAANLQILALNPTHICAYGMLSSGSCPSA